MLKCMQGGSLNLEELRPALVALQQAAASAEREKGELAAREKEHRDLAEKCLKAAIAMDAIEEEEKKRKLLSGGDAPVEIRVALMMARRGRRPEEVAAKWPAAGIVQQGSGPGAKVFASRKVFRLGVLELPTDGKPATPAEADAWFDAELVDSFLREEASPRSSSPPMSASAAAPAAAPAADNVKKTDTKGDLRKKEKTSTVDLVHVLYKAKTVAMRAKDEQDKLAQTIKNMEKDARKEQGTILSILESNAKQAIAAKELEAKQKAEEEEAEVAAKEKAEKAKQARAKKAAEEKAAFEAKVAAKRQEGQLRQIA